MLKDLKNIIGKKKLRSMYVLLGVMFFGSLLELAGISLIVTLCSFLIKVDSQADNPFMRLLSRWTGIGPGKQLFTVMILFLILFYLFRTIYLIMQYYLQVRFVKVCGHDVSMRIFKGFLEKSYENFIKLSSADIISLLNHDCHQVVTWLNAFLQVITEVVVMLCMIVFLLIVNPVMSLFVAVGIAVIFLLVWGIIKKRTYLLGIIRRRANRERVKWMNQAVHGIKDIKIGRTENYFIRQYEDADDENGQANLKAQFWSKTPNLCMEAAVIICILCYMLYLLVAGLNLLTFISSLSALVLVAVRLLPACSRINFHWAQMNHTKASLEVIRKVLEEDKIQEGSLQCGCKKVRLSENICVKKVTYQYNERQDPVLEDADMDIPIGASVGIVGTSGVGKTTLVDILLGLLKPQNGKVLADGINIRDCYESYLSQIAYIPQMIFMIDDTIRNNVALGVPVEEIDDEAVWQALKDAALYSFVKRLPKGLDTKIGERGIRLSGGERQRLGFARALYRNCPVMVFDESTSALDLETEASILESIHSMKGKKTLIIISHRPSTVADCDVVYRVEERRVLKISPGGVEHGGAR